jgi:hypothetical protein
MIRFLSRLLRMDEPLGGKAYALIGLLGFLVKYGVDSTFARVFFHRPWTIDMYLRGRNAAYLWDLRATHGFFYISMLAMALPFMAFGVAMTVRRLRTLRWNPGWAALFFVPYLNVLFFAVLSFADPADETHAKPHAEAETRIGRLIPRTPTLCIAVSAAITALLGAGIVGLNAVTYRHYGLGLFVLLPFVQGLITSWIAGYHEYRDLSDCAMATTCAGFLSGFFLLIFAFEGIICILMAAPIWLCIAFIGSWVGWMTQRAIPEGTKKLGLMLLSVLSIPGLMGAEYAMNPQPPVIKTTTSLNIQAPPDVVWNHVVSFSELPTPTELIFHTGLAYPIRARIEGSGVGAIRHCEFSTGEFLEPIEVWNRPSHLRFSVINTPSPMEEMSLYTHIKPPHLHGYMVSRQGEFRLTALPGGGTHLEGTTWYVHNLWPARYWQLWSDVIIHQIHLRVLRHIKTLAEADARKEPVHG